MRGTIICYFLKDSLTIVTYRIINSQMTQTPVKLVLLQLHTTEVMRMISKFYFKQLEKIIESNKK